MNPARSASVGLVAAFLSFAGCGQQTPPSLPSANLPPARHDESSAAHPPSIPRPDRTIYFLPVGKFPPEMAGALAAELGARLRIKIETLPTMKIDRARALDPNRNQLIAEELYLGLPTSTSR